MWRVDRMWRHQRGWGNGLGTVREWDKNAWWWERYEVVGKI